MKKHRLVLIVIVTLGCSKSPQESTANQANIPVNQPNKEKAVQRLNPELEPEPLEPIDSLLNNFQNSSQRLVRRSEGGGGDCYGWASELENTQGDKLVTDRWDCGEYGFGHSLFLLYSDTIKASRKLKFERNLSDDPKPYKLSETIHYFDRSIVRKKTRVQFVNSFKDTTFSKAITYQTIELFKDSILQIAKTEIEEAFLKASLED